MVGKWHLGLGKEGPTDFNKEIDAGPRTVGFDYSFIYPATGDRVPCIFVENHKTVNLNPSDPIKVDYKKNVEGGGEAGKRNSVVAGRERFGFMSGGKSALWKDEDIADTITGKAVNFIKNSKDKTFFLYFATNDVHAPLVPHPRFKGSSQAGLRGDAVQSFDWSVGKIVKTVQDLGIADNTMIIIASDNGGYRDYIGKVEGYSPNGQLRGFKADAFEGGVRVPLIVSWPKKIKYGKSDSIISFTDLMATLTAVAGLAMPENSGQDSINQLPVLLDPAKKLRNTVVTQYTYKSGPDCPKSIRDGKWKLIPEKNMLFDLENDIAEKHDLAKENPGEVERLKKLLQEIMDNPKSR